MKIFLQKSLPRFFLLVVLFLSGCSVTDMIYVVSGRTGSYYIDNYTYKFTINFDGTEYTDVNDSYTLQYISSGNDYIEYGGYVNLGWVNTIYITVVLTELGDFGGTYNLYYDSEWIREVGFSWHTYTSN